MSEIVLEDPFERRKRELTAEREQREARKAREAETASANWYAAVDGRIHEHLKSWLWKAIDERIQQWTQQWWEHEWDDVLKDAIGEALGKKAAQVRDELTRAIEEQQRSFEAKLAEQKERLLASSNSVDEAQGRLREEFKRALEELCSASGAELAALEARLRAVPSTLPAVKTYPAPGVTARASECVAPSIRRRITSNLILSASTALLSLPVATIPGFQGFLRMAGNS